MIFAVTEFTCARVRRTIVQMHVRHARQTFFQRVPEIDVAGKAGKHVPGVKTNRCVEFVGERKQMLQWKFDGFDRELAAGNPGFRENRFDAFARIVLKNL